MDIITKQTRTSWKAWLEDNKEVCETGKTEAEAVGKLMLAAEALTGISIIREDED